MVSSLIGRSGGPRSQAPTRQDLHTRKPGRRRAPSVSGGTMAVELTRPRAVLEEQLNQAIVTGRNLIGKTPDSSASATAVDLAFDKLNQWDRYVRSLLDGAFTEPGPASVYPSELDKRRILIPIETNNANIGNIQHEFEERIATVKSIIEVLVLYSEASEAASAEQKGSVSISGTPTTVAADPDVMPTAQATSAASGPIFVVHGHDRTALLETVRVLERGTGREVIILHEQANAGRTILEKFEDYAENVSFAVVLLTGDDEGGVRSSDAVHLRARQNVIFELGFFFGRFGRKRVVVLLEDNVERPSDIQGLVYITLDQRESWKYSLARELEAASIPVDRSRIS